MEYAEFGNFRDFLKSYPSVSLETRLTLCLDASVGLQAVHECGVVHGDVKPENILIFWKDGQENAQGDYVAKIADFGGSVITFNNGKNGNTTQFSLTSPSSRWCAPHHQGSKTPAELISTDAYSFGMTVWAVAIKNLELSFPADSANLEGTRASGDIQNLESLKLRDDLMLPFVSASIAEQFHPTEREILESFMDCTLKVSHQQRELPKAIEILRSYVFGTSLKQELELTGILRKPDQVVDDLTRLLQVHDLKEKTRRPGLQTVSLLPTDGQSSEILNHVLSRIERSIPGKIESVQELKEAVRLGIAYINDFQDSGHIDDALALLLKCAKGGLTEIQGIIYRLYCAFDKQFPEELTAELKNWLQLETMKGSTTAKASLVEFDPTKDSYKYAIEGLRFCFYGIGQNRFSQSMLLDIGGDTGEAKLRSILETGEPNSATDRQNDYGDTLLHLAAVLGKNNLIKLLLDSATIDPNVTNDFLETPLLYACRAGHTKAALYLIERGGNPLKKSMFGDHCLHWLSSFDDHEISMVLRVLAVTKESLFDVALEQEFGLQFEDIHVAGSPLHRAVVRQNLAAVRALLGLGADPYQLVRPESPCSAIRNESPVAIAARFHHHVILNTLLQYSKLEDKSLEPTEGHSLLRHAFLGGSLSGNTVFGTLLRHGKMWKHDAVATLEVLFQNGADKYTAEVAGFPGCTALALAAIFGDENMVAYVLDRTGTEHMHTPAAAPDKSLAHFEIRMTPVEYALGLKKRSVVALLINRGARTDDFGNSEIPLHDCIKSNHDPALLQQLIDMGFPVDLRESKQYETPFAMAIRYRKFRHAEVLLKCGADVNAEFERGDIITLSGPSTILGFTILEMSSSAISALNFLCNVDRSATQKPSFIICRDTGESILHRLASIPESDRDENITMEMYKRLERFFMPTKEQLDMQKKDGATALIQSVIRGNDSLTTKLLEAGASTNIVYGSLDYNPLGIALKTFSMREFWQLPKSPAMSQDIALCKRRRERIITRLLSRDRVVMQATRSEDALFFVIGLGDCELIRLLIGLGLHPNAYTDEDGNTALHVAVSQPPKDSDVTESPESPVSVLVELGADLEARSNLEQTPLHLAAFQGNVHHLRVLLENGAKTESRDKFSNLAIEYATGNNHIGAIEVLLKHLPCDSSRMITDAIFRGITFGHIEALKLLLPKCPNITQLRNEEWEGPLAVAAKSNQVSTLKFLTTEFTFELDSLTSQGFTALHHASQEGHVDSVGCLLDLEAQINCQTPDGLTSLHLAAMKGHIAVVEMLLQRGADVHLLTTEGANCVDAAASLGQADMVKLLVAAGADCKGKDEQGGDRPVNAICLAVMNGRSSVVETLLELGVDPSSRTPAGGLTALHLAAIEDKQECIAILLAHGALVADKDEDGYTPIHYAVEGGKDGALQLLLNGGADLAAQNRDGQTALHLAAKTGKSNSIIALLDKDRGCLDVQDKTGCSALHLAAKLGHTKIVQSLLEAGANLELLDDSNLTPLVLCMQKDKTRQLY